MSLNTSPVFMLAPPPPLHALEKVVSFLSLLNSLVSFSPPGLAPDRVLGFKMEHGRLHMKTTGSGSCLSLARKGIFHVDPVSERSPASPCLGHD